MPDLTKYSKQMKNFRLNSSDLTLEKLSRGGDDQNNLKFLKLIKETRQIN